MKRSLHADVTSRPSLASSLTFANAILRTSVVTQYVDAGGRGTS